MSLKLVKKVAEMSGKFIVMRSRQTHEASSASIQFIAIRREREVQSGGIAAKENVRAACFSLYYERIN